jgi:hypothetical protein
VNVLFIGQGQGSWQIRGVQIAKALGARASTNPTADDWRWADVVVLVKRAIDQFGAAAQRTGVPILWDVLDCWEQPDDNDLPEDEIVAHVTERRKRYGVSAVIGATRAMAIAIQGTYLPHHARPGLRARPVLSAMTTVAYEGQKKYLGSWFKAVSETCASLGLTFVVNPPDLSVADVVVSFRGEKWDGPICRQWKSGVKVVNALTAGRPLLTQSSAAFREIESCGLVVNDPSDLASALKEYLDPMVRQLVASASAKLAPAYAVSSVAQQYQALIADVMRRKV